MKKNLAGSFLVCLVILLMISGCSNYRSSEKFSSNSSGVTMEKNVEANSWGGLLGGGCRPYYGVGYYRPYYNYNRPYYRGGWGRRGRRCR